MNAIAGESGLRLSLDRRSVTHWLAGRQPRAPLPDLVAEALSRGLGCHLTAATVGMAKPPARRRTPPTPSGSGPGTDAGDDGFEVQDVSERLQKLGYVDPRRQMVDQGVFRIAALSVPSWAQALSQARTRIPGDDAGHPVALEARRVRTAELLIAVFADSDDAFGGGHQQAALSSYLAAEIAPLLHAPGSARDARALRAAACQLTYLAAFMCFDQEQHALAQRYYRIALDLAAEAGDTGAYAVTLRAMSVQARVIGHHRHAVHLAEAAATTGRALTSLRRAFLLGQLAVARAADADRAGALSSLSAAERYLERAGSGLSSGEAVGAYHPAALAHQQAAVQALLGDRQGAVAALTQSLATRPADERRSRAITTGRLAELHLATGHLDQAIATWHSFLDDYPHLRSERTTTCLTQMRQQLRPHTRHPAARHLLTRAATM
ncbi:hypothetical protein ACFXG6_25195 [Streptomyces roseus]|uniref:hypothetical protein n=1 Tax=Streptomyces roseus TaxID=66430 RepID=UPI00368D9E5E